MRLLDFTDFFVYNDQIFLSCGGHSSVGRAPDCDSGCRGFKPRWSPQISSQVQLLGYLFETLQKFQRRSIYRTILIHLANKLTGLKLKKM